MVKSLFASFLATLSLATVTDASAGPRYERRHGKADRAVSERVARGERLRVIVRTRSGANARVSARAGRRGGPTRMLTMPDTFAAELDAVAADELLRDADVLSVSLDERVATQAVNWPELNP